MQAGGGALASKKLLAALAVLAVAFVVLAAVPALATDSDADEPTADLVISDAQGLWSFAESVNKNGDNYSGKLVVLDADIDLGGAEWWPIGQSGYSESGHYHGEWFVGTFDGRGHTISNFNVTKDVWEAGTTDTEGNTLGNVKQGDTFASGFFGFVDVAGASIKNLTIDNAIIYGCHWCGVIAGWFQGNMENCHVKNSKVSCVWNNDEASGDKAGALTGYIQPGNGVVVDCSATNCQVDAARDAGQLIGTAQTGNIVSGCKAINVVVTDNKTGAGTNINNSIIGREIGEVSAAVGYITSDSYSKTYYASIDGLLAAMVSGVEAHVTSDCTVGDNVTVDAGSLVIDGGVKFSVAAAMDVGGDAAVTVKSGASFIVLDGGSLVVEDTTRFTFEAGSTYVGPAIFDVDYADGSVLTYEGSEFVVWHIKVGEVDVPVMVSRVSAAYTGEPVDVSDIAIRVISINTSYTATTPSGMELVGDYTLPDEYDNAIRVWVSVVSAVDAKDGAGKYLYADLIILPVDISGLEITVDPSEYVYTGDAIEPTFKVGNSSELAFDITKCKITYFDSDKNEIDEAMDVGSYYAVVTAADGSYYTGTTDYIPFEIVQAEADIELVMDGDAWTVGNYANSITYELGEPETDGSLRITAYVTWATGGQLGLQKRLGATITSQDDLDEFITGLDSDPRAIYGYTVSFVMDSAETQNFKAGKSDTVGPVEVLLVPEEIVLGFSADKNSNVKVEQDGTVVKITSSEDLGLAKTTDGKYSFTINVDAAPESVVLVNTTDAVDGRLVAVHEIEGLVVSYDDDNNITTVTFTFDSLPVSGGFTFQAKVAERTVYIESDVYTIDLSGLISNDLSIWLHEGEKTVKYDSNQLWDMVTATPGLGDVSISFLNGGKFYMPATQKSEFWTLKVDGETVDTYQPGSVYLIDGDDRSSDGIIHFYASVAQYVAIIEGGYFESGAEANEYLSGIIGDAFLNDCVDGTMYFLFNLASDSDVTATLFVNDGEGIDLGTSSMTAGIHVVYFADVSIEYGHVDYGGYVPGYTYTVFIETENDVDYYAYEAPAEPEQSLDIVSVGYAAENGDDVITAALKAAGSDKNVTDTFGVPVMYIVFTMNIAGDIDFSIDGKVLKTFEDYSEGIHAIYWTTEDYVAGQAVEIGIADGDTTASITYIYVPGTPVVPEPVVEYTVTFVFGLEGEYSTSVVVEAGSEFPADAFPYADVAGYTVSWPAAPNTVNADVNLKAVYTAIPVEPVQTLDIVSVGYAAENGDDVITAALKAAGSDKNVTDTFGVPVMYIVFTMNIAGDIDFSIDGKVLKTFEDYSEGIHAIYWTTEDYVAGQAVEIGIADGDTTASITYIYVPGTPVVPEPEVVYSGKLAVMVEADENGFFFAVVAKDGNAVPSGSVTISYSFMVEIMPGVYAPRTVTMEAVHVDSDGSRLVTGYVDAPEGVELRCVWGTFAADDAEISGPVQSTRFYPEVTA